MPRSGDALIVLERHGHWAECLRLLAAEDADSPLLPLYEARSWSEAIEQASGAAWPLLAIELTAADAPRTFARMAELHWRVPAASIVVLADREAYPWRSLACELGIVRFIASPRRLDELPPIIRRWRSSGSSAAIARFSDE